MSDILLSAEIVHPGAADQLDPSDLDPVPGKILQASRATRDRGVRDFLSVIKHLIDQGRWSQTHKDHMRYLLFEVWEDLSPEIQRQVADDVANREEYAHMT